MSTERASCRWLTLLSMGVVAAAWTTTALHLQTFVYAERELQAVRGQRVQANARWQEYLSNLDASTRGLQVALTEQSLSVLNEEVDEADRYISVSLNERWLELREADQVIWNAPVAIGRGWADDVDQERRFSTPRGRREILDKVKNPIWIPPDWHYREVASNKGVHRVNLERGQSVSLSDGSRVEVRGLDVGRVAPDGGFTAFSGGRDVVVDGKVIQPPFGTRQRRKKRVMGSRKLALGRGYAIHGTNKPWSIGRAASHGCLRMMNKDIEELYALVDVGTPVFIY